MSFKILPTNTFVKELKRLSKKYPSLKFDMGELSKQLYQNHTTGTPLGNNCYKILMAISSKTAGKSAAARVIT